MSTDKVTDGAATEILPNLHLIRVFADDMTERNWADKADYIKQQVDRISAALAQAEQPVAVKPLEWEEYASDGSTFKAKTDLAHYVVWEIGGRGFLAKAPGPGQAQNGDLDAAKAAAQADFNQRILSALAHPPAKREAGENTAETAAPVSNLVPCPCTLIEQDEDCPVGYPSLICGVCEGKGHTTQEQVTALACEMIKIASDMGEPEDPFAAWESIELLKSQPAPVSTERVSDTPSAALEASHE